MLACAALLVACGGSSGSSGGSGGSGIPGGSGDPNSGESTTSGPAYSVPGSVALVAFNEGAAQTGNECAIDTSQLAQGVVGASARNDARLKFQVVKGERSYNYDLPGDGTSIIVPIMAIAYILIALWTTIANIGELPAVFGTIFQSAFNFQSIAGGFAGSVVMLGIKRGLFSNEAGMGSAPNAAATASVSHPVKQGLVQSLSVYIDTLLICTCSAMMVMVFWVQDPETAMALNGMPLVQMAVNNAVGEVGIHFITFAIFAFAFSSLIGNYFYAETNFRYIFKNTKWGMLIFRVLCLAAIFYGCVNSFDLAWNLADIFMGFMAIINLVAILLLGKWALAALDDYTRQRKEGKDPVFIAASVPGMPACECWTTADLPNFGDNPVEEYIEEAASLDSEGLR